MADHHQCPGEFRERRLQLFHQHRRQVVGGLVHNQGPVAAQQQPGQGEPALLARGEAAHRDVEFAGAEQPQAQECLGMLIDVAAEARLRKPGSRRSAGRCGSSSSCCR